MRQLMGPRFVLMQDNVRAHSAVITRNFLRDNDIEVLQHPAISPDLNPIEHVGLHGKKTSEITKASQKHAGIGRNSVKALARDTARSYSSLRLQHVEPSARSDSYTWR